MRAERIDTRFATPVESPISPKPYPITTLRNGHALEAVPWVPEPDDSPSIKARYAGHWIVIERDPVNNRVRESSGIYYDRLAAYYAYWHRSEDEPLEFEAWTSVLFSASASEAA